MMKRVISGNLGAELVFVFSTYSKVSFMTHWGLISLHQSEVIFVFYHYESNEVDKHG